MHSIAMEIIEGSKIVMHCVLQNYLSALDIVLQACCIVCYDNIIKRFTMSFVG